MCSRVSECFLCCSQWYVGHLEPGNSRVVKGPGPIDRRFGDGGTPTTYPADGTSFLLPLAPPYNKATIVTCGATWAYFQPGGVTLTGLDNLTPSWRLSPVPKKLPPTC